MTTAQEPLAGPSFPSRFKSVIDDLTKIVLPSSNPRERGISPKPSPQGKVELRGARKPRPPIKKDKKEVELGCGAPALPELEALCGDLTTATNINRAVAQVFLLLAQGRISRRDALAFGSLARLLLRTVPAIRGEFVSAFGYDAWEKKLKAKLEPTEHKRIFTTTAAPSAKAPVAVPAPNSHLPAAASPPAQPPAANVAPPPKPPAVSCGPLPSRPPEIPPGIPEHPAGPPVPDKVPSPAAGPTAEPVIRTPRLVWVERLQQLMPESSL